jgi:hypothetical protein
MRLSTGFSPECFKKGGVHASSKAYVDLVRDGRTLQSVDHRRANCNGVFKVVTFDVEPGRYIVQVADAQARNLRLGTIQR